MSVHSMVVAVSAGLALLAGSSAAHAAEKTAYPNKPIRLIVPFPPGGSADPLARAYGAWFSDKFGVTVVADNRPGAGTAIAHTLAAKASPDGYTLILGASSGLTTNPAFGTKLDYDPIKDFSPMGLAAYIPQIFVVHPAVTAKNMGGLIDLAKAQPGKVLFGTPGIATVGHLTVELLSIAGGVKFTHVPYKGAGPGMVDLVGGRIHVFVGSVTSAQAQVSAGRIRPIAIGHPKRLPNLPDVPAVAETFPGFTNDGWFGVFGPAGTPRPIVMKIAAEMTKAQANAEFVKHLETIGMLPGGKTPEELHDWVRSEIARWTKVVRDAGIQAPTVQ